MTLYTSGYFKAKQLTPVHTQIEMIFLSTSWSQLLCQTSGINNICLGTGTTDI